MKKAFALLIVAMISITGFAQELNNSDYDALMKKSRRAKTTSIILVSTGPVIAAGGVGTLIYGLLANELEEPNYFYDANGNLLFSQSKKYTTEIVVGAVGAAAGMALALSSIAFSNKAYNLRRAAKKIKMKSSADHFFVPGFQNSTANTRINQYKLSLMIPLGR